MLGFNPLAGILNFDFRIHFAGGDFDCRMSIFRRIFYGVIQQIFNGFRSPQTALSFSVQLFVVISGSLAEAHLRRTAWIFSMTIPMRKGLLTVMGCEENKRDGTAGNYVFCKLKTVPVRQIYIQQNQIVIFFFCQLFCLFDAAGGIGQYFLLLKVVT